LSQPLATHDYALGLQSLAKHLGVWICAGIHEIPRDDEVEDLKESKEREKVFNSHVAIGPDGLVKGCYRKVSGVFSGPQATAV
jgi:predicted amidohydrolase